MQRDVEHADGRKPDDDDDQGRHAFVHQHLVDHDLKEQRRDQREQLHEQGRDQHVGERHPVAPDRRQEPAEAEQRRIDAGAAPAPCHQDDFAIPNRRECLRAMVFQRAVKRIADSQLTVRLAQGENAIRAVLHAQDCRHRNGGETIDLLPL